MRCAAGEARASLRTVASPESHIKFSPKANSRAIERSAHTVAEARGLPDGLKGKRGRPRFYRHVEALRLAGAIREDSILRPGRNYVGVHRVACARNARALRNTRRELRTIWASCDNSPHPPSRAVLLRTQGRCSRTAIPPSRSAARTGSGNREAVTNPVRVPVAFRCPHWGHGLVRICGKNAGGGYVLH